MATMIADLVAVVDTLNAEHAALVEFWMKEPYPSSSYERPWSLTTNGAWSAIEFFGAPLWSTDDEEDPALDELRRDAVSLARYAAVWASDEESS